MELTFDNWKEGAIELSHTYKNNTPDFDSKEYSRFKKINISEEQFPEAELLKIEKLQKEYFSDLSKKFVDKLYDGFKTRYESSVSPLSVLESELGQLNQILKGKWSEEILGVYTNRYTNVIMLKNNYLTFKNYIERTKNKGFEPTYNFMPSPNSKFYSAEIFVIPEVYADAMFNFKTKLSSMHPNPDQISMVPMDLFQEPDNKHPHIFTNGWAFEAFERIEEVIAVNNKSYNADYTLIYHCLHYEEIQAILRNVDKIAFSEFINQRLNGEYEISPTLMKKSTSVDKKGAIRPGIRNYLKDIGYNGDIQKLVMKITT